MVYDTLFLDRDGVLNRKIDNGYVLKLEDIELLPGMDEFLAWAVTAFNRIIVVTNQRCVGRGLLTNQELSRINAFINAQMKERISAFYTCPHLDEDRCACRKPKPGLFLKAAGDHPVEFKRSWMIGDSETDLIPAKHLGIGTIFINTTESIHADVTVSSTSGLMETFSKIIAGTIPVNTIAR